jgi:hypothetical protein
VAIIAQALLASLVKWRGPPSLSLARHGDHLREHRSDEQRRNWISFGICQRTSVICSARRGSEPEGKTFVDAGGDSVVRMPLGCIGGRARYAGGVRQHTNILDDCAICFNLLLCVTSKTPHKYLTFSGEVRCKPEEEGVTRVAFSPIGCISFWHKHFPVVPS